VITVPVTLLWKGSSHALFFPSIETHLKQAIPLTKKIETFLLLRSTYMQPTLFEKAGNIVVSKDKKWKNGKTTFHHTHSHPTLRFQNISIQYPEYRYSHISVFNRPFLMYQTIYSLIPLFLFRPFSSNFKELLF
jgi:hypothetical protein